MFLQRFIGNRKSRRIRVKGVDQISEQVREVLQKSDQKIILMVRG